MIKILTLALIVSVAISDPVTLMNLLPMNGGSNYQLTYSLNMVSTNVYQEAVTLSLYNYNVSGWTSATANGGIWLGAGFNCTTMACHDYVRCAYIFMNKSTDAFTCHNQDFDEKNGTVLPQNAFLPIMNENLWGVNSGPGLVMTKGMMLANFTVNFMRNFTATSQAMNSWTPAAYPIIYAWGLVVAGNQTYHGATGCNTTNIDLT
jgi:hypothetical protein